MAPNNVHMLYYYMYVTFIYVDLQDENSVVTCSDETRHNLQEGDYVTFSEVEVGVCVSVCVYSFFSDKIAKFMKMSSKYTV